KIRTLIFSQRYKPAKTLFSLLRGNLSPEKVSRELVSPKPYRKSSTTSLISRGQFSTFSTLWRKAIPSPRWNGGLMGGGWKWRESTAAAKAISLLMKREIFTASIPVLPILFTRKRSPDPG